jgi:hypothetical protein
LIDVDLAAMHDLTASRKNFETRFSNRRDKRILDLADAPVLLAHLLLPFFVMKKVALFLLFAVAVAYYFGYEPSDLIPSLPTTNSRPPRVRPAPATQEPTPAAAPQRSSGALVAAGAPDGSLANRWEPYPSASPKKP